MGAGTTLSPVIADDGSIRTTDKRLLPNQLELRGGVRPMNFFYQYNRRTKSWEMIIRTRNG